MRDPIELAGVVDQLGAVRERLARLEARGDGHERVSAERHEQVLTRLEAVRERLQVAEKRSWRASVSAAALAGGGSAGLMEVVRVLGF